MINESMQPKALAVMQMVVAHARTIAYHQENHAVIAAMLDRLDWLLALFAHCEDRTDQFVSAVRDFCNEFNGCMYIQQELEK